MQEHQLEDKPEEDNIMRKTVSKAGPFNTCTLTGLSLVWGVMLGLINPYWSILGGLLLMSGFGSELRRTYE